MASLLRNSFSEKNRSDRKFLKVYDVSSYDATFDLPKQIFKLVGLRLTRNDSPFARLLWNIYYWIQFMNLIMVLVLELIKIVQTVYGASLQDAEGVFRMIPCIGYLVLAMEKSYKMVIHRSVYENLVTELRDMWPNGEVSEEEHIIISTALKRLKYIVTVYYWCSNVFLVIYLSAPYVEIAKIAAGYDVPLILNFYYWYPFDPFERGYYEFVLALQTWHGLITIWCMLSGDLMYCLFMSHLTTQFDLLSVRIRRLVNVTLDQQLVHTYPLGEYSQTYSLKHKQIINDYDDHDWEVKLTKDLSDIIIRHQTLIRLSDDMEGLSSFSLLLNFLNSSIIICFCGFCCLIIEKWNEMIFKIFLATALTQTWIICWYGQRLFESSEGVSDALYSSGWYKASEKIKKTILIMLYRAQKNVKMTTYGFSAISLATYTTIIKSAWSYFTLLLNIYKN